MAADPKPGPGQANVRGDVRLTIGDEEYCLSLTLASLAEIELGLGVQGFSELGNALRSLSAEQLTLVLVALLRGGGAVRPEALALRADPMAAVRAIASCFKANLA